MAQRRFSFSNLLPTLGNKGEKSQRKSLATSLFPSSNLKSRSNSIRHSVITQENYESVVIVWLDFQQLATTNTINLLRSINDSVQVYTDFILCFQALRSSNEKIFFISSSGDNELITAAHDFPAVEAIFVFDPDAENMKNNLPKVYGVFNQQDKLFRELKETLEVFEQVELEVFVYEDDDIFLWRQFWKEDLTNRKGSSNKNDFIAAARSYYQNNIRVNSVIDEFEKSYRATDVLNWCFRSPFPVRFLQHTVCFQNKEQLNLCRFLFVDAIRFFQKQSEHKFCSQVYRGMKLSNEHIDRFEQHVDKLVCASGFFPCTKSRTNALALASFPTYRPDRSAVLFKIDCESTDLFIEIPNIVSSLSTVVFDVCMTFRVMCINRGQLTVIKLKTAGKDGKKITQDYLAKHNNEQMESLLDQLLPSTKSMISSSTRKVSARPEPLLARINSSMITTDELEAKKYVDQGEIDLALIAYRRIQPVTARILNAIGQLCANKKGDYDYAFKCYSQALKMQEQDGDDISETLTNLGYVHRYRGEHDMALACHKQALTLRETASPPDLANVVISLVGISHAQLLLQKYEEAIANAERALTVRETLEPFNEIEVAKILVLLGNIYNDCGKHTQALDRNLRALAIVERATPVDLHVLAELLNNIGSIHRDLHAMDRALPYLDRAVEIYAQILPRGHPDRVSAELDLERANQFKQKDQENSSTYL